MRVDQTKFDQVKALAFIKSVGLRFFEDLDTPVSLSCYLLLKYGDYKSLVTKDVDPLNYLTAYDFQKDYSAVGFFKKAQYLPTDIDRSAVALEKFMDAEAQCKVTNDELSKRLRGLTPGLRSVPYIAQQKIAGVLGSLPSLHELTYSFGPGATSSCRGLNVTIADKLQSKIVSTKQALPTVMEFLSTLPHVSGCKMKSFVDGPASFAVQVHIQDWNELFFVPKTAKTDRCICIEPHDLVPLQKGYGSYIRNRLRLMGLDLSKQADVNRHLARIGSIDGSYATIDLSSASDTIAISTVFDLLPISWASKLSDIRSPYTKLPDGTFHENEKFSSMGNGFTFELETLIFYCLALAVRQVLNIDGQISVFGDDIIVPTEMSLQLIEVLQAYGFTVNKDKTFIDGPFRESCGCDYFCGVNVRPYFNKELIECEADIYPILNGIRHLSGRFAGYPYDTCDSILKRTWVTALKYVKPANRFFGPAQLGDDVIFSSRVEAVGQGCFSHLGFIHKLERRPKKRDLSRYPGYVQLTASLLKAPPRIPLRSTLAEIRKTSIQCSYWAWYDGMWV